MDSPVWVYLLGLCGMAIYGTRIVVQWYLSERSHQVESPGIYWVMSSIGAIVLYIYGWLRKDFSIIFGESLSYYIYMWNIGIMGLYKRVPKVVIVVQAVFPLFILALISQDFHTFVDSFLRKMTLQEITPEGLAFLAPTIVGMAQAEGLDAHARAVTIRIKGL